MKAWVVFNLPQLSGPPQLSRLYHLARLGPSKSSAQIVLDGTGTLTWTPYPLRIIGVMTINRGKRIRRIAFQLDFNMNIDFCCSFQRAYIIPTSSSTCEYSLIIHGFRRQAVNKAHSEQRCTSVDRTVWQ